NKTYAISGLANGGGNMGSWGMVMWNNDRTANGNDGFFGFKGNTDALFASSLTGTGEQLLTALSDGTINRSNVNLSDLVTTSQIGAYLPLAGGTMNTGAIINWTGTIRIATNNNLKFSANATNTFVASGTSVYNQGIFLRPIDLNSTVGQWLLGST